MFAFLMVGVAAFFGLALNVSQLFQERAHLQICADAAAFSGAVQQARGLNQIARINTETVTTFKRTQLILKSIVYPTQEAGQLAARVAETGFQAYNAVNLGKQLLESHDAVRDAKATAGEVTRRNEPAANLTPYLPNTWGVGRLTPTIGARANFGFFFAQATPSGVVILYDPGRPVKAYVLRKSPRDIVFFTARVLRPAFPWLFTWGTDGVKEVRDLRAYATAKPAGGALWQYGSADPQYRTKLVRTGSIRPQPRIPDNWGLEW
jgi:hypothetical protein